MRISVPRPDAAGRMPLRVLEEREPWRVIAPGESDEALLDPRVPTFLAHGYPDWLRDLCERVDADREFAEAIVREVRRRR